MPRHPELVRAAALLDAGRNEEAVAAIRQLASTSEPEALFHLAELTWQGNLVEQEPARARTLYQYSGALGHPAAGVITTNFLATGLAGVRDWHQAVERLKVEAEVLADRRRALALIEKMDLDGQGNPRSEIRGERLSKSPDVKLFRSLLSPDECDYLRDLVAQAFEPSMVFDDAGALVRDPIRTSDGAALHWLIEDPAAVALNRRIASASRSAYEDGEALALLRYVPGQEYRPHFDFDDAENRRVMTMLVYLNDDYDGGETEFVRTGLKVKGATGDAILFRNDGPDGRQDPLSEHAGLPVTRGTKFLATRWIREARWLP